MTSRFRSCASTAVLVLLATWTAAEDIGRQSDQPTDAQLAAWWIDLEKEDPEASRALLKFASHPDAAVMVFRQKLQPLILTEARLQTLLLDLEQDDESVWKPAFEELEYFDPRLALDLLTLMKDVTESPARQRLVEILSGREAGSESGQAIQLRPVRVQPVREEGYNFFSPQSGSWWAEHRVSRLTGSHWGNPKKKWLRAVRAMTLLEHWNTPSARGLLTDLAAGHPEAQPTRVAKAALEALPAK